MKKIFVVAALIISSPLLAQDSSQILNEVIVTANKFPQKQSTTGKVVTVIGQDVLSRSSGKMLTEILNQQAGITIIGAQNTLGSNQDVYVRGASLGRTLILMDGIPAYDVSAINNAFDLNHFSIDNIERIEIVKGAQSTVHGSDAVAGVINIITKKISNKPLSLNATAAAGSYNTYKGMAGMSGNQKNNFYNLHYSHVQSKGFSAAHDSTGNEDFDKDGYEQNIFSGAISSILAPGLKVNINGKWSRYKTDLDAGAFTDERDFIVTNTNLTAGGGVQYRYKNNTIHFNYNINNSKRDYLDDSIHIGGLANFTTQQYTGRSGLVELYGNLELNNKIDLLIGSDARSQNSDQYFFSLSSFGPYETRLDSDTASMKQYSAYASLLLKEMHGFFLEAGGRFNHHSEYGQNFTYTLSPSYLIKQKLKLFANVASAFKVPSLYQLYDAIIGERNLEPERSTTAEAGVEYNWQNIFGRLVYFERDIRNGIDYDYVRNKYFNNSRQKDYGLELEAKATIDKFSIAANYTFVTGEVMASNFIYDPLSFSYIIKGDTTFNNLYRRPKHIVNFNLVFNPIEKIILSTHLRFAGKRFDPVFMSAPIQLDSYYTIDFFASYAFNSRLKAFADFKNITDKKYFDVRGYNSRRFNFMTGIQLNL
jgi:vitamin B12 transporter